MLCLLEGMIHWYTHTPPNTRCSCLATSPIPTFATPPPIVPLVTRPLLHDLDQVPSSETAYHQSPDLVSPVQLQCWLLQFVVVF